MQQAAEVAGTQTWLGQAGPPMEHAATVTAAHAAQRTGPSACLGTEQVDIAASDHRRDSKTPLLKWTAHETARLLDEVQKHGNQQWNIIAKGVPNR